MKVLVTGGRNYSDELRVYQELDEILPDLVIHGGASGADLLAKAWSDERGVPDACYSAKWTALGRSAGPRRNDWMLRLSEPDLVLAFPGGRGTADCLQKATYFGIAIKVVKS